MKRFNLKPLPWYEYGFVSEPSIKWGNTLEHFLGLIYIQNLSSMIPVYLLSPKPGERVLDIAAAPGSKTTQIAQHMENKGLIVANDISVNRIKALTGNIDRMGVLNTVVTKMDGRRFGDLLPKYFDKVLVDAPCSAEGLLGMSNQNIWRWNEGIIKRIAKLQKQLLISGFKSLKPRGILIYATCTFAPEENEEVISSFLEEYQEATIEKIEIKDVDYTNGIQEWESKKYHPEVKNMIRLYPHKVRGEGFCIAKIRKSAG